MAGNNSMHEQGMSDEEFRRVMDHVGRLEEHQRAEWKPRPLPLWYNNHPAARRLPRRPPIYFPKKCPRWKVEGVAGKGVVHPIWLWYYTEFRYGGSAKTRRPYKMPLAEQDCTLTSEELADVKEVILEIKAFEAMKRDASIGPVK